MRFFKKIIKNRGVFIPGIIAAIVLFVVGYFVLKQNWNIYTNSFYGYSIKYPRNFLAAPLCEDSPDNEIMISTKKVNCDPGFSTDGKILMWIIVYKGNFLQNLLKPPVDMGPNPKWTISKTDSITVDGVKGTLVYWKDQKGNIRNEVILVSNDKTYRLTQLSENNYEEDRKLFGQIVSTFKFTQ